MHLGEKGPVRCDKVTHNWLGSKPGRQMCTHHESMPPWRCPILSFFSAPLALASSGSLVQESRTSRTASQEQPTPTVSLGGEHFPLTATEREVPGSLESVKSQCPCQSSHSPEVTVSPPAFLHVLSLAMIPGWRNEREQPC